MQFCNYTELARSLAALELPRGTEECPRYRRPIPPPHPRRLALRENI